MNMNIQLTIIVICLTISISLLIGIYESKNYCDSVGGVMADHKIIARVGTNNSLDCNSVLMLNNKWCETCT